MWNRSAALNTGVRLARHPALFLTDVDIIYPRWFVERVIGYQKENVFFASACFRCPKAFADWDRLAQRHYEHKWSEMKGKGLMCCPRRALEEIGGLDERFAYWGQEDHDLSERLARFGLQELDLQDLYSYHQWHPHVIYDLPLSVQFNNLAHYYSGKAERRVRANETNAWGQLARFQDRAIYSHIDPEHGILRQNLQVRSVEAFGVATSLTIIREMVNAKDMLWAVPRYEASDRNGAFLNKVLRRAGWRLDRRLGYAGDLAQGLLLAVPGLFRDYFLDGTVAGRNHAFLLT
jgi:hypothetical protein